MRTLKTSALAKDVFTNPNSYLFEMEVKFKNIYKNGEVRKQVIKAGIIEVDASCKVITCEFNTPADHPIFFSFNHQARFSKATLFITGPQTDGHRKALSVFQQYIDRSEDEEYTISSLNLQFRAALSVPTHDALQAINPPARKKLLFANEDAKPIDFYLRNEEIKTGGIFQINKMKVTIPTE